MRKKSITISVQSLGALENAIQEALGICMYLYLLFSEVGSDDPATLDANDADFWKALRRLNKLGCSPIFK